MVAIMRIRQLINKNTFECVGGGGGGVFLKGGRNGVMHKKKKN